MNGNQAKSSEKKESHTTAGGTAKSIISALPSSSGVPMLQASS